MQIRCPSCGSASVKKSAAVYGQGQSRTTGKGGGLWVSSSGRIGAWSSRGSSARISAVAERNAPPSETLVGCAGMIGMIGSVYLGSTIGFGFLATMVLAFASTIGLSVAAWKFTSDERADATDLYSRQWYCSRCGNIFREPKQDERLQKSPVSNPIDGPKPAGVRNPLQHFGRKSYADRIISPEQRARSETERDSCGLVSIAEGADAAGVFHPERNPPLDLGLVSRLASLGYLTWDTTTDSFAISDSGTRRLAEMRSSSRSG